MTVAITTRSTRIYKFDIMTIYTRVFNRVTREHRNKKICTTTTSHPRKNMQYAQHLDGKGNNGELEARRLLHYHGDDRRSNIAAHGITHACITSTSIL